MKRFITTPIYYPNSKPHIGSAYTTIVSDFFARLYRELGYKTYFLTGVDEHGEKIQKSAESKGKSPQELVDEMADSFKAAWKKLGISYDRFIRTTEDGHKKLVRDVLRKVYEKGDIYKDVYEGYYCVGCERYYTEKELMPGLLCPYHHKPVEKKRIDAYFFKLTKYKDELLKYFKENPKFLSPKYKEEILNKMDDIKDICISRPVSQVSWGITLPFDEGHVAYVWFDALLNYMSGLDGKMEFWPPDLQFMGKDIIWFHSVLWPAMLISAGYELPKREIAHGFLTVDGKKMSKSLGNVIDPLEVAERYSVDTLRYYLLTKVPFGDDGDFSWKGFKEAHNSELLGHYGNLANRLAKLWQRAFGDSKGESPKELDERFKKLENIKEKIIELAEANDVEKLLNFYGESFLHGIGDINAYLNEKEPWRKEGEEAKEILRNTLEAFLYMTTLLKPLLPVSTKKVMESFNINLNIKDVELGKLGDEATIPEELMLFKKVEE